MMTLRSLIKHKRYIGIVFIILIGFTISIKVYHLINQKLYRIERISNKCLKIKYNHYITYQKLSPSGNLIEISSQDDLIGGALIAGITGDNNLNGELPSGVYNTRQFKKILELPYGTNVLAFSKNSKYMFVQNTTNSHLYVENISSHSKNRVTTNSNTCTNAMFFGFHYIFYSGKNYQFIYDYLTNTFLNKSYISSQKSTLSQDGNILVLSVADGLKVYNYASHKIISKIEFNNRYISQNNDEEIKISPDKKYIICTMPNNGSSKIICNNNSNHCVQLPITNAFFCAPDYKVVGIDGKGMLAQYNIRTKKLNSLLIPILTSTFTMSSNGRKIAVYISPEKDYLYKGYLYLGNINEIIKLLM